MKELGQRMYLVVILSIFLIIHIIFTIKVLKLKEETICSVLLLQSTLGATSPHLARLEARFQSNISKRVKFQVSRSSKRIKRKLQRINTWRTSTKSSGSKPSKRCLVKKDIFFVTCVLVGLARLCKSNPLDDQQLFQDVNSSDQCEEDCRPSQQCLERDSRTVSALRNSA